MNEAAPTGVRLQRWLSPEKSKKKTEKNKEEKGYKIAVQTVDGKSLVGTKRQ